MTSRYRPPNAFGRRRRRVWWWLALLLLILIGGAVLVNSRGVVVRQETAFFDSARIATQEVEQVAAGFRRLVSTELRTINRDDFDVLMDRLSGEMADQAELFQSVEAPESAFAVREMLDLAFAAWAAGLVEFRVAVTAVTDDPTGSVPVDQLGGAIARIRVGDLVYARFLARATGMLEELGIVNEIPAVSFIVDQRPLLNGERLARTIRSSTDMGVRRDVTILQVVFEPLPAGGLGEEGEILFPATERLQFSTVIGNRGNVDQKGLIVNASIRSEAGESLTTVDSHGLDLAPGEVGSVLFGTELVEPGAEYLLTFKLTVVEDDLNPEDNVWESLIRINPPG